MTPILILALQASTPAPRDNVDQAVPSSDTDIVVLAQRMRLIDVDIRAPRRNGRLTLVSCRVTNGSGNPEMDAIPCATAQECMASDPPNRRALEVCVEENSQIRLDELIMRWRRAWVPQP